MQRLRLRRLGIADRLVLLVTILAVSSVVFSGFHTLGSLSAGAQDTEATDSYPELLASQATRATVRAQVVAPDPILCQIDVDLRRDQHTFRFTDGPATEEITIVAPTRHPPRARWPIHRGISPLASGSRCSALDVQHIQMRPETVAQALRDHWPESKVDSVTLATDQGKLITWHAFGTVPQGVVSGKVRDATGAFAVQGAGRPAQRAPTAPPPAMRT